MNGSGAGLDEFVEERVAYIVDQDLPSRFIPRIAVSKTTNRIGQAKVEKSFRAFEAEDVQRVLDFDNVSDPPPDGPMMHGEANDAFPSRHFCLRGGFLFYFDLDSASGAGQSHYVTYHGPPLGVIPLDKVTVSFPPGGRRCFREHAQTNARKGYEFAILHEPGEAAIDSMRPPAFVVTESLVLRDRWANAIKARARVKQQTGLRSNIFGHEPTFTTKATEMLKEKESKRKDFKKEKRSRKGKRASMVSSGKSDKVVEDGAIQEALQEFGKNSFSENAWIDNYFESHTEEDAETRYMQMENWQDAIKKGLQNAVLEQYEYFVEASAEMTKMGREVVDLKTFVETQVETVKEMKEIDFTTAILGQADDHSDGEDMFNDKRRGGHRRGDDQSDASSVSSYGDGNGGKDGPAGGKRGVESKFRDPESREGAIEIPDFFEDAAEEILAFVKESRYSDATDLWAKSKQEVTDIMQQHEKPTVMMLTKKQFSQVQTLIESLDESAEMISNRLVEALRRKNEALKRASKRERSDPMTHSVPSVSPCCLSDDSLPLRLLVKLGKTQEAATAYSARRSLLLLESLHERPLSGTGNVDLVIYAAQLSQSFFSCLAGTIEGFLDLFLSGPPTDKEDPSLDESSIHTDMQSMRNLPAGALASIVLWCDSELTKFAATFGGARILGNLALSPPANHSQKRGPRVLGKEDSNGSKERQTAIEVAAQCVGQAFQYASENLDTVGLPLTPRLAESLRKRLKGCEAEVAKLLDEQWRPIVLEWQVAMDEEESHLDERRRI